MLSSSSHASQESRSTPPGKATLPREEHLVITPAPSDHGSFASVDETALPGRKRSFAEAVGGNEGPTRPGPALQDFPHGFRGQHYQHGICPPYLPPAHIPGTTPLGSLLPALAQRPGLPQSQANPVTVSHATPDMLNVAATRSLLGIDQFHLSEMWTLNRPPGSEYHRYPGTQQFMPTRVTSDGTPSMDPAYAASPYGVYDGSQLLQGIVPQRMPPYSLTQLMYGQPVRGYGREHESPTLARNNVGGGSSWLSTTDALSWQDYGPAA